MEKKTEKEIRQEVEQLLEEIARLKEEAQQEGLAFSSLSEEELVKKVRGESSNSPFIIMESYASRICPESPANYRVWSRNPDPGGYSYNRLSQQQFYLGL